MDILRGETGSIFFNQESANLVVFVFNFRPDHGDVGDGTGSDPHLLAVEDVFVANFARARLHAAGVRAEARLRQPEAA